MINTDKFIDAMGYGMALLSPSLFEDYRKKVLNKQKPESRETKEVIRIIPGLYEENVRNREYDEKLRRLGLKD